MRITIKVSMLAYARPCNMLAGLSGAMSSWESETKQSQRTWRVKAAILQAQHQARLAAHEEVHHIPRRGVVAACTWQCGSDLGACIQGHEAAHVCATPVQLVALTVQEWRKIQGATRVIHAMRGLVHLLCHQLPVLLQADLIDQQKAEAAAHLQLSIAFLELRQALAVQSADWLGQVPAQFTLSDTA